ncbi:MAG: 2-C-methyl-D-erythritol 4-phosphate cytidylyltransferase [Gammaproteobacteria bacterium]|nr:2-C-methyl-D-erythritol 4-phosphate cytidylyltransferase [Gammaproteobacteria bacterium]
MEANTNAKNWVIIPAAGSGSRMGADLPKQYLQFAGKTVIEHTLSRFGGHPKISGIVVALSSQDKTWDKLQYKCSKILIKAEGGAERCHSVLNALRELSDHANEQDWVLVHDAARPCIQSEDIDYLIHELGNHPVGGLLAVPVRDTMKRSDNSGTVQETVERENLWHALTPQMFRLGDLRDAMAKAISDGIEVTDEASAMEYVGKQPKLVKGQWSNIKITHPEDLALAEFYLNKFDS